MFQLLVVVLTQLPLFVVSILLDLLVVLVAIDVLVGFVWPFVRHAFLWLPFCICALRLSSGQVQVVVLLGRERDPT